MLNSGLLKELHAKVADDAYVLYEAIIKKAYHV